MKILILLMTYDISLSLWDRKGVFSREIRVLPALQNYTKSIHHYILGCGFVLNV